MRQLLTIAVLALAATGVQAEPKFSGLASKPASAPASAAVVELQQPKLIEFVAPEIALKTHEVATPDLDKRLAKRVDATKTSDTATVRAPAKLNIPEPSEEAPAAATSASAASNR